MFFFLFNRNRSENALTSSSGLLWSFSDRKSMSLEVTIPTSLLPIFPVSVTGIPEKPCLTLASNTSPTVWCGLITTGSVIKPCSNLWERTKVNSYFPPNPPDVCTVSLAPKPKQRHTKLLVKSWSTQNNNTHKTYEGDIHHVLHRNRTQHNSLVIFFFFLSRQWQRHINNVGFTLTFRASLAWNSGVQLWWMMPMPPISWKVKFGHCKNLKRFNVKKKKVILNHM